MESDKWDDVKIATAFMKSVYNEKMMEKDWKILADEVYSRIHNFRQVFNDYTDIIESLPYDNDNLNIELDDITRKIYTYISNKHINKKRGKQVTIQGITYSSITDAANKLHTSRTQIQRLVHVVQ